MTTYIGIDWGVRKIGVAFGNDEMLMAFIHGELTNDEAIFHELTKVAIEHEATTFVIGKSAHPQYSDNVAAIDAFGKELAEKSHKDVLFVDEMFSTREARENLKRAGHKNLDEKDDAESARVILQHFLDSPAA